MKLPFSRRAQVASKSPAEEALDAALAKRRAERVAARKANAAREVERLHAHRLAMQAALERRP